LGHSAEGIEALAALPGNARQHRSGQLSAVIRGITGWGPMPFRWPTPARRTEAASTVAVIAIAWCRPVIAVTRPAIAPLATIADKLAIHVADVANATIHITQRSSAPASICPAAICDQRISAGCHMCASAQIRSWGSTLGVRVCRGGRKRQHHGRSRNETTFSCKPSLAHPRLLLISSSQLTVVSAGSFQNLQWLGEPILQGC
jgi:hypothetical protein